MHLYELVSSQDLSRSSWEAHVFKISYHLLWFDCCFSLRHMWGSGFRRFIGSVWFISLVYNCDLLLNLNFLENCCCGENASGLLSPAWICVSVLVPEIERNLQRNTQMHWSRSAASTLVEGLTCILLKFQGHGVDLWSRV